MSFRRGAKADAERTPTSFTIPKGSSASKARLWTCFRREETAKRRQNVAFIGLTDLVTVRSSGQRHTTAVMAPERAGATRKKSSRSGEGQRHLTDRDGIHLVRWVGSETV